MATIFELLYIVRRYIQLIVGEHENRNPIQTTV